MIKFFRKIRQNLLNEGKTTRYFKYAIGEIVLVVIGILIALQINTWNQERLSKNELELTLSDVHKEFLENKRAIEYTLKVNIESFQNGKLLMSLIGKTKEELQSKNIDELLFQSLEGKPFKPTQRSLAGILQHGRLELLQNDNLKNLIFQWTQILKEYDAHHNRFESKIDNDLVPFLSKNYSLKDIDMHGTLAWENKTELEIDKLAIFNNIEFENILDDLLYRISRSTSDLEKLVMIIDAIVQETKN